MTGTTEHAGQARYVHKECGGTTVWDLSGGFCTACHAEGLDMDDVERRWKVAISMTRTIPEPEASAVPSPPIAAALDPAEVARLRDGARILGKVVTGQHRAMEAARIELAQGSAGKAMQWILNSLPDVWDDPETEWDGSESADEWWDRTDSFYREAEADAGARGEELPSPAPRGRSAASTGPAEDVLDVAAVAARAFDYAWHEANRGNWESVTSRQVRRLIEGAAPVLVAGWRERAEAAEAKVALIAEFCRDESEFLNTGTAGVAIVRAADILAIIGTEEDGHG